MDCDSTNTDDQKDIKGDVDLSGESMRRSDVSYDWKDITNEFLVSCEDLKLGELLHDSSFGLFEAMSAIEMMDSKMDAGMICNQAQRQVYNLSKGIEAGVIKVKDLETSALIAIVDDTLACVVTWLEGHSLAQTVFTNLYLHDPSVIEDRTLKALSFAMLRIVDHLRDTINKACVFEEEDFQSLTYGFKLSCDVTDNRVMGMLREVEEDLNKTIRNNKSKTAEERDQNTELEHEQCIAVHARVKFTRELLALLLAFNKEKVQGLPAAQKLLTQITEHLQVMRSTKHLGIVPTDEVSSPCDYPAIVGFDPLVNQRLLPPTFPRYTKIKTRSEAFDYFGDLLQQLKIICGVADITDLHTILEFFLEFSKISPCVFARSVLQLVFLSQTRRVFGVTPLTDSIRDSIRSFIMPPCLMLRGPLANNSQCKEFIDAFLVQAVRPMSAYFQITGHNRARQRDKFGHLLEDLAALQEEANKVDAFMHRQLTQYDQSAQYSTSLGTWVLYHTLNVMIHYTLAGFELELYAIHEYHYVYWYLHECLFRWQVTTLSRAETFLQAHQDLLTTFEQQQKGRSNRKKAGKGKKRSSKPHAKEALMFQALQNLTGGYYKAVLGLGLAGKIHTPSFEFDSEEVRYIHRFAPFGALVTPPLVSYTQYLEMTDLAKYHPPVTPGDLYSNACDCFQQARVHYESIHNPSAEVQTLLKIAKNNFVVIKLLLGGHQKDSMEPPKFDFSLHKVFPLIKLA